ncbi:MAG: hypothetical protein DRP11_03065 [Candidatus Aenigmatarchaeota archaeon]|nr:MAG: hypothetical protein DRP11_03065 [Candidatus Aenigmarchaeota archaeon]
MDLETYLVEKEVRSRVKALKLISEGRVKVNGIVIRDPRIPVDDRDLIEIIGEKGGYYEKLKEIQEATKFLKVADFVILIEPRDMGFAKYLLDFGVRLLVLTRGNPLLDGTELNKKVCDLRNVRPLEISREKADSMISELKLDPIHSFQIIGNLIPLLKENGRLLMFLPTETRERDEVVRMADEFLQRIGVEILRYFPGVDGIYIFGRKSGGPAETSTQF